MPRRVQKYRRTYIIANPFNGYDSKTQNMPVKVFIEDRSPPEDNHRLSVRFEMEFRTGKTTDGWIWVDSWYIAMVWADQRVGLNTEEPVVHIGQRYGTPQYK